MQSYLGIDFGTSNTHAAHCTDHEGSRLVPNPVRLGGKSSTVTCVLWREPAEETEHIVAYGTVASEEWNQLESAERNQHRFAFGFKPDLVRSERARRDAKAFFHCMHADIVEAHPGASSRDLVVVGVPAEISREHRDWTIEIARDAGFSNVECVDEPLGALAYHLNNCSLTLAQARQGVVVVDFGGGTLDVALVGTDGLREPWGDPTLGGRLFDDLFFQWVQDQNGPLDLSVREGLVVWQSECRRLKEDFSRHWKGRGDGMKGFKGGIAVGDGRKWLRDGSVTEFESRARNYRCSSLVLDYFRDSGLPEGLATDKPIDLYEWIRRTLSRGRERGGVSNRFGKVILTGGSSDWPFMRRMAAQVFGVDPDRDVIVSDDPNVAVGSGLALFIALRSRHKCLRQVLRSDLEKKKAYFGVAVNERLHRFAELSAALIADVLMPQVEAHFWNWYRDGGSLEEVEGKVAAVCDQFEPQVGPLLAGHWLALDTDLVRLLRDHLKAFVHDHALSIDVSRYIPDSFSLLEIPRDVGNSSGIRSAVGDVAATITTLTGAVGAAVIAALKIKTIIVLTVLHWWLGILMAFGALLAYLGLQMGTKKLVENALKKYRFNRVTRRMLHLALPESKFRKELEECRSQARRELSRVMHQALTGPRNAPDATLGESRGSSVGPILLERAELEFTRIVSVVISDLGVLEQIGNRTGPSEAT